eukprot:1195792-Prorocentrum_minimum.AAC.3
MDMSPSTTQRFVCMSTKLMRSYFAQVYDCQSSNVKTAGVFTVKSEVRHNGAINTQPRGSDLREAVVVKHLARETSAGKGSCKTLWDRRAVGDTLDDILDLLAHWEQSSNHCRGEEVQAEPVSVRLNGVTLEPSNVPERRPGTAGNCGRGPCFRKTADDGLGFRPSCLFTDFSKNK